jgi:hypothetical protein
VEMLAARAGRATGGTPSTATEAEVRLPMETFAPRVSGISSD